MSEGAKIALIIAGVLGGLVVVAFIAMQIMGFLAFSAVGLGAKGEGPFGMRDGASGFYTGNMYRGHVDLVDGSVTGATLLTAVRSAARGELLDMRGVTCPDVDTPKAGALVTCSSPGTAGGMGGRWVGIVEFRDATGNFDVYAATVGMG